MKCGSRPRITKAILALGVALSSSLLGENPSQPEDLLRFRNGDSLHGSFLGLGDGELRWRHSEAAEPITLRTDKIRRLSFNGGRARKNLRSPSFVQLADGDRIPGTLVSL
ncbi:MAG TPA: hypothetical protein DIV39_11785, partial [Verrucomicrobiales bacterium]|nr:hypothetical protein [Verrucomicrobiales bacterium]